MTDGLAGGRLLPVVLLACLPLAACVGVNQDGLAAARAAEPFVRRALLCGDAAGALALADPEFQAHVDLARMRALLGRMSAQGRPGRLSLTAFEPIPAEPGVNVFVDGEEDGQTFHYRLILAGTGKDGYKVAGVFRQDSPYPPSTTRVLLDPAIRVWKDC